MQKKLMVVFLCGLMAMLAEVLQAANVGSTSTQKAGWCDAARWVSGVAPAADDGNEYWATNNFQSTAASVEFPCPLHIGAPAGSVLGNAEDLTPLIYIQAAKINWNFSDLKWHGGTLQENNGAASTDKNVITGNVKLLGTQDHVLSVQTTTSKSGQFLQFNATLTGDEESVLTIRRVNGTYAYAQAGAYGIIKMGGDSSGFSGSFATGGTTFYDTIFFATDNPLGNPAMPNAAALVLKDKAVLAFANDIKQSANRGIRIDGDEVYLMNWKDTNDDWSIESPITKGAGAAAAVYKDGSGAVTLDCAYSAGDITVKFGTLVLSAKSTFPTGQKLKVEAGAKVISYRSLTGFEITGEGAVERRMAPMVVTYEEGVTTPVQLGGDFDIESGLIQPIALSQPIALPFHATNELHLATIAAGARAFVADEFVDQTEKTYGLPHTWLEVRSGAGGSQEVWLIAKPVVTTEEATTQQFFTDRTIWSNDELPQPGFDYLVRGIAQQQNANAAGPATFGGDSLTCSYRFYDKTRNYTIPDMTLWKGVGVFVNISNDKLYGNLTIDVSATEDEPAFVQASENNSIEIGSALHGSGTFRVQNNNNKDDNAGKVTFSGDNSDFTGNLQLVGGENASIANITLKVSDSTGFGGAPETARADAFQMSGPAVINPMATMTLETGKRGWTVSGGMVQVDEGNVFTLKESLTLTGTLTKTGAGTLVLGGAAAGDGTLSIQEGALQPLTADCCQPFSVRMAEGTTLVLDLADESLCESGFQAADLQPSSENDTITVRIENAASVAAGRGEFEVVLCTLPADTTDVSGSMAVTARGYKCRSVTRVAVPDSDFVRYTVTLWKPGLALILR